MLSSGIPPAKGTPVGTVMYWIVPMARPLMLYTAFKTTAVKQPALHPMGRPSRMVLCRAVSLVCYWPLVRYWPLVVVR